MKVGGTADFRVGATAYLKLDGGFHHGVSAWL